MCLWFHMRLRNANLQQFIQKIPAHYEMLADRYFVHASKVCEKQVALII